ncbi:MAG: ISL3 family transposase [Erysipelotrichaceae bacterium]|nr:ISL3 family transposase [Erysipelotrichaceae bacterium]
MKNLIMDMFNVNEKDIDEFCSKNDEEGNVEIVIRLKKKILYCPKCENRLVSNGIISKYVNHKVLSDRKLKLLYKANRYKCKLCGYSQMEKNPFAFPGFSTSILVMNQVMTDLHNPRYNYTIIAQKNDISVNEVILYGDSFIVVPHIPLPVNLGIDEFSSKMAKRKDASYLGVLTDNDHFALVDVLPSRNKSDLNNYLSLCPKNERDAVKYVTIDMWKPYEDMVRKWLKNAVVAVDPFHVIEHLTKDFSDVRIRIMKRCIYGSNAYYLLKTWHKLLESDQYNLNNEPRYNSVFKCKLNYSDLKKMLLELDDELRLAYELKEAYRDFNSRCSYEKAEEELDSLIFYFAKADIREYDEFIQIMISWKKEIINSFIRSEETGHRLSNAKAEAMNNSIETNIHISNGLANFNRFRKRMIYCFNDRVFYSLTSKLASLKRELNKKKK